MADKIDKELIGGIIEALPLDKMIMAPVMAIIQANIAAGKAYADFLGQVCVKDEKVQSFSFIYNDNQIDADGKVINKISRTIEIPLIAAIHHPCTMIKSGVIEFELTVQQAVEEKTETAVDASGDISLGWGPFKLNVKAQIANKSSSTRTTDTRARYSIKVEAERLPPPEGISRVIDTLLLTSKPALTEAKQPDKPAV